MNIFGVVDLFYPNATTTSAAIAITRMPKLLKCTKKKPGNGAFVLDDGDHAAPQIFAKPPGKRPPLQAVVNGALCYSILTFSFSTKPDSP